MADLVAVIDQQLAKANDLVDFCNVVCNEKWKNKLLLQDSLKTIEKLKKCKDVLVSNPALMNECRVVLRELRRQEVIMKLVLEKTATEDAPKSAENNSIMVTPTRPIVAAVPRSSVKKLQWDKRTNSVQPASAKKSASFACLDDFAYSIAEKEFSTIPKYLRGREQLNDLQRCVDEILCPCLIEKYSVLNKPNNEITNFNQRQLKRHYQDQESYFPGHYFITEGDIARFISTTIDKRLRTRIQMLRQLGLIKEMRKNSTAYYMWMVRIEN